GDAMITVQDTGQGIKPEFLPHVFDRFRQEDATTTRKFNGLGLGLAITRQLVEMHGGKIEADSPGEQQGATFTVYLPLSSIRALDAAAATVTRPAEPEPSLAGLHVLLVDDEPDGRELVQRVLEERGARVTSCESAAQGLTAFRIERPDVIISDIGMPEQDGYQFIRRIRLLEGASQPCIPAAALTAMARSEDRRRALLAGFQTHVAKPIDPLELVAVLAALSGRTGQHAD
ncbi:MAG: response regulator, partial [Pseudomonadota bacterium]|nr:response regulator [Pseudomonadota bacterium]